MAGASNNTEGMMNSDDPWTNITVAAAAIAEGPAVAYPPPPPMSSSSRPPLVILPFLAPKACPCLTSLTLRGGDTAGFELESLALVCRYVGRVDSPMLMLIPSPYVTYIGI